MVYELVVICFYLFLLIPRQLIDIRLLFFYFNLSIFFYDHDGNGNVVSIICSTLSNIGIVGLDS